MKNLALPSGLEFAAGGRVGLPACSDCLLCNRSI